MRVWTHRGWFRGDLQRLPGCSLVWQYGSHAPFQFLCPSSSLSFPCVHGEGNVLVHALVYLFGGFRLFLNSSLKGQLMSVT